MAAPSPSVGTFDVEPVLVAAQEAGATISSPGRKRVWTVHDDGSTTLVP